MGDKLKRPVRFDYAPNVEVKVDTHSALGNVMRAMRLMQRKVKFK
jgi:hypothetical protein